MKKIVAIGGGEIGRPGYPVETTKIDKEIIRLSGKKHPKLLFLPTASNDAEGYVEVVKKHFGKRLGCTVSTLLLCKKKYTSKEIIKEIMSADIIYVGGGNTLKMMKKWRTLGVDKILEKAYEKGVVLSGLSAGSICWFEGGHSDSLSEYRKDWGYIRVKGLGFLKGTHCPHFDSSTEGKKRKADFLQFMKKHSGIGVGIDNKCAIEFVGTNYRVIATTKNAKAYRVFKKKGDIVIREIPKSKEFRSLKELYE